MAKQKRDDEYSENWGGPRPGSGRPKLPEKEKRVTVALSVKPINRDFLRAQESGSALVDGMLDEAREKAAQKRVKNKQ